MAASSRGTFERFSRWPETVLGAGVVLGAVAVFLPWWEYKVPLTFEVMESKMVVAIGLQGWGLLFAVSVAGSGGLLSLRAFGSRSVAPKDLPVLDWFVHAACAVMMLIAALAGWDSLNQLGVPSIVHQQLLYGWWLGISAALLILSGAVLLRAET